VPAGRETPRETPHRAAETPPCSCWQVTWWRSVKQAGTPRGWHPWRTWVRLATALRRWPSWHRPAGADRPCQYSWSSPSTRRHTPHRPLPTGSPSAHGCPIIYNITVLRDGPELVWATGRLRSPDRGFGTSCLLHCGRLTVSANSEDSWKRIKCVND